MAKNRTIAVDIDDTLNDFSSVLRDGQIAFDASYGLPEETFHEYQKKIRANEPEAGTLLSTQYTFFRYQIHAECYRVANVRPEGALFMQWLRTHDWKIIVCTSRDLRRTSGITRDWLTRNHIPFDHLFMAANKIVLCKAWDVPHLVDDDRFNVEYGSRYGVNVYFPISAKHHSLPTHGARGFEHFEEIQSWIHE